MSQQVAPAKATKQIAESNAPTLFKLALFTAALGLGPLSSYYGSKIYLWNGNSTYAAITAICVANAVLVTFIIVSVNDDKREQQATKGGQETKKSQ